MGDWCLAGKDQRRACASPWGRRAGAGSASGRGSRTLGSRTLGSRAGGKRIRRISFFNGECFQAAEDERDESAFVFEYARKWEGVNEEAARRAAQGKSWNVGRYQTLIQRLAIVMAFLLMLMAMGSSKRAPAKGHKVERTATGKQHIMILEFPIGRENSL